jgi:Holliday junction resolvase RusA-like endonuclease
VIRIVVYGEPRPKGSPQIVTKSRGKLLRHPRVLNDSAGTTRWARTVAGAALVAMVQSGLGTAHPCYRKRPLRVVIVFRLPRPPSEPVRAWPHVKPDLDKLVRSTMDPLERIVFDTDSRIVECIARKEYASAGEPIGATIEIDEMPACERQLAWVPRVVS